MSDTELGAAGDSLVFRPLPKSSPQVSAGYDLSAVQMTESKTPAWSKQGTAFLC